MREFKTILHRYQGATQATLLEFPESPRFLQQRHAALYADNYGDAPPVNCPRGEVKLKDAQARMPCKDTTTGFASNAGMGPSGTIHIPHDASLHRFMSMDAPHQDPNTPNMGTLVAVQELRSARREAFLRVLLARPDNDAPLLSVSQGNTHSVGIA